jgi:hypothetical protein
MKIANVKGLVTKTMVAAIAAGALLFAAPTRSQAQVFVGLRLGRPAPVYVAPAPVYAAPAPYGSWARRDAYIRHQEWLRDHRFDRDHFRDHDRDYR